MRLSKIGTATAALAATAGLLTGAAIVFPAANAAEVYRWIDADGVVHFSDTRPEQDVAVETLTVEERNPPDYDPADDPYNILNQAERTGEMLARVEKEHEEREERQRSESERWDVYDRPRSPYLYNYASQVFLPPYYPPQRPIRPQSYRRQWNALEQNDLTGRRPASINSGEHAARVERSRALPLTAPEPRSPRP